MPRGSRGKDDARRAFERARLRLARMGSDGAGSLATVFRDVTAVAADTLGVERVGIWLFVDENRAIRCFHLYERSKLAYSEGAILYRCDIPTYFRALLEQRDIAAEDARSHPFTSELTEAYLEPLGIASMLDAAIYREGKVCGVVCHEHVGEPRAWTIQDRDFAAAVADSVAIQLERAESADMARNLRLERSEVRRLRELSQVAAGAAHDFRNLLLVASWLAREITEEPGLSPGVLERAERIREAIDKAQTIAAYLGTLDVGEATHPQVLALTAFVEKLRPMLDTALGSDHALEIECSGDPGFVLIDKSQLERVILNLVVNARDAMRPGGEVHLVIDSTEVPDGEDPPGSYARVAVRDTGAGMDTATRAKIFDPYFTTKERERSSGLGLAVVHRAVDRAGGFVHVESEIGRGSTFRVYLPRVAAPRPGAVP
jgi:two-component system cell cycle sensor histidine kinase/response regulator CckA